MIVRTVLPNEDFSIKILSVFLHLPHTNRRTNAVRAIFHDVIILTIRVLGKACKLWNFSLYNFCGFRNIV
jgi:hypothetical protein